MENNKIENKKSIDFLLNYSWRGKDREQIIKEMELEDYEQKYLDQAIKELAAEGKYTGYDLDRRILLLIDMHEDEDDFDEDDVVYIR
ncbi:hypothetical protein [Bacillus thuringiensis]|uniref:hypothetical protein n=1 Tax=Bacillus cereus group TaxID=86661 RepID=UPI001F566967|nr:hypothetical protein [Bacillus thuringiensis]